MSEAAKEFVDSLAKWQESIEKFTQSIKDLMGSDVLKWSFGSRIGGQGRTKRLLKKRLKAECASMAGIDLRRVARRVRRGAMIKHEEVLL